MIIDYFKAAYLILTELFLKPEIVIPSVIIGIMMGIIAYYLLRAEAKEIEGSYWEVETYSGCSMSVDDFGEVNSEGIWIPKKIQKIKTEELDDDHLKELNDTSPSGITPFVKISAP